MMTLLMGWEEKMVELNQSKFKCGYKICEGKSVKNRIKAIYQMIRVGQAVVVSGEEESDVNPTARDTN